MAYSFKGKVAIVTGGASGLGAALAGELATRGSRVLIADIDLEKARSVAKSIGNNSESCYLDVRNTEEVSELVKRTKAKYGSLDLMVNNAGVSSYGEISDTQIETWDRVLQVNLRGVINGSLAAYSTMQEQKSGRIINIASMAVFVCDPLFGPYVTSKSAVFAFTRVLAIEAEANSIAVTLVCPGNIRTPLLEQCKPSRINPPISARDAAVRILNSVARGRRIVVFPFYARVFWWLDRLNPRILNVFRKEVLRRARLRATS